MWIVIRLRMNELDEGNVGKKPSIDWKWKDSISEPSTNVDVKSAKASNLWAAYYFGAFMSGWMRSEVKLLNDEDTFLPHSVQGYEVPDSSTQVTPPDRQTIDASSPSPMMNLAHQITWN
jgi:hypothetical protein